MSDTVGAEFRNQRTTFIPGVPNPGAEFPPPAAIQPAALTVDEGVVVGGHSDVEQDTPQAAVGGPTPAATDTLDAVASSAGTAAPTKEQDAASANEAVVDKVSPPAK